MARYIEGLERHRAGRSSCAEAAESPGKDRGLGKADRAQRIANRKLLERLCDFAPVPPEQSRHKMLIYPASFR